MNGRLLVAYSNASNYVATTAEYLSCISRFSEFEVSYVHVTNAAELDFDLNEFDAIFQSYCVRLPVENYVSASYIAKLKSFQGVKLLAVQDEYDHTNKLKAAVRAIGYHVMLTNAPETMVERIYPRREFPHTEFITVLTGYVPEALAERGKGARPLRARPIQIGYRGRRLDAYYGRLGFEKFEIGRRMREICVARGIPHDIEWTNDKRLYGDAWYDFIGSCRTVLGSETGSNVFDFDGTIRATYQRLTTARGAPVPYEEFRTYTDPIEAQYDMGQISPRIFEAAAMRTPMVLFSGRYLGLIKPDEHYIELNKDFSNIDAVLGRLGDVDALDRMAARAYDRLVGSGEFSYRRFAKLIDATVVRKAQELGVQLRPPTGRSHPADANADLMALTDLREGPTEAPRHFALFHCKHLGQQNILLTNEIARLNQVYTAEFVRLNTVLKTETTRLDQVYTAEIARLNAALTTETARLNRVYKMEIVALTKEIARLDQVYKTEITRLNAVLAEETAQLNAVYTAEIARLHRAILELRKRETRGLRRLAVRRIPRALVDRGARPLLRRLARLRSRLKSRSRLSTTEPNL